jgi:hypothetical protein
MSGPICTARGGAVEVEDSGRGESGSRVDCGYAPNQVVFKHGPQSRTTDSWNYRPEIGGSFYIADTVVINNQGEPDKLTRAEIRHALPKFQQRGFVLLQHDRDVGPIGTVIAAYLDDRGHLRGRVSLFPEAGRSLTPTLREDITNGTLSEWSISWRRDPVTREPIFNEVTLCMKGKVAGAKVDGLVEASHDVVSDWPKMFALWKEREKLYGPSSGGPEWGVRLEINTPNYHSLASSQQNTPTGVSVWNAARDVPAAQNLDLRTSSALSTPPNLASRTSPLQLQSSVMATQQPTAQTSALPVGQPISTDAVELARILADKKALEEEVAGLKKRQQEQDERDRKQQEAIQAERAKYGKKLITAFRKNVTPYVKSYVSSVPFERLTVPEVPPMVECAADDPQAPAKLAAYQEECVKAATTKCGDALEEMLCNNHVNQPAGDFVTYLGGRYGEALEKITVLEGQLAQSQQMQAVLNRFGGKRTADDVPNTLHEASVDRSSAHAAALMNGGEPPSKMRRMDSTQPVAMVEASASMFGIKPADLQEYGGHAFGNSPVAALLRQSRTDYRGKLLTPVTEKPGKLWPDADT